MATAYPKQIDGLEPTPAEDGFLIYLNDSDKVHYLNPVATIVLLLCTGEHTINDIAQKLQNQFNLPELPLIDVETILNQFIDEELVQINEK